MPTSSTNQPQGEIAIGALPQWTPAILYSVHGTELQCDLCPHRCRLRDGQTGYCGVRRRAGDRLESATFATTVQHVDSVERKPLYHWRPGTRAITLAAPGCSFRCGYCVNHRLSQFGRRGGDGWRASPAEPEDIARQAAGQGAAIALSYSEPSLAIELTLALARAGTPLGVPLVWKTNGFLTPEAAAVAAPVLAAVNVDIKAAAERAHRRLTGAPLAPVLEAIARLRGAGVWVEVSTPIVPGTVDRGEDLQVIASWIAAVDPMTPWHLLRFTPTFRMTAENPTTPEDLAAARDIGLDAGLRHVYVERALGPEGRRTVCPACGAAVVERGIWAVESVRVRDGRCPECREPISGVWGSDG
jgi:pyruvate formate lyase activating enzyme